MLGRLSIRRRSGDWTGKWRFKTGNGILSSPAIAEGTTHFGSMDGIFYAVDAKSGHERWRFETNDIIKSSPTWENQTVYFGGDDGQFYALDAETGQKEMANQNQSSDHLVGLAH
jgi:eukaryotic-like serine/threonine-protein kinase